MSFCCLTPRSSAFPPSCLAAVVLLHPVLLPIRVSLRSSTLFGCLRGGTSTTGPRDFQQPCTPDPRLDRGWQWLCWPAAGEAPSAAGSECDRTDPLCHKDKGFVWGTTCEGVPYSSCIPPSVACGCMIILPITNLGTRIHGTACRFRGEAGSCYNLGICACIWATRQEFADAR